MAKQRRQPPATGTIVTPERAARLFHLVALVGEKPQTRSALAKRLAIGVRDFYRDLEILRRSGLQIEYAKGRYFLATSLTTAQAAIPFPNPGLTLGEAEQLAKGRGPVHRKLKEQVQAMKTVTASRRKK